MSETNSFECSICKDKLKNKYEFLKHKEEHIEETEEFDISTPTNGHEMFECNMCSFESGHEDSVKDNLIDHLNHTKEPKIIKRKVSSMTTMTMEILLRKIWIQVVTMILKQTMTTVMKHRQWHWYKK